MGLASSATIASIIEASVKFLAHSQGHSSIHEVRKYLLSEHADRISLESHDARIKKQLKEMFDTEIIVPFRRNLKKQNVAVQFKLAPKSKKKTATIAAAKKSSPKKPSSKKPLPKKQPAKKPAEMESNDESDAYSDNEDVPPNRRI